MVLSGATNSWILGLTNGRLAVDTSLDGRPTHVLSTLGIMRIGRWVLIGVAGSSCGDSIAATRPSKFDRQIGLH